MKILSIETSCDETALSILEGSGSSIKVLGNALATQIELHAQYGGVFPTVAKRAHAEKIIPLLKESLTTAKMLTEKTTSLSEDNKEKIIALCGYEEGLAEAIISFCESYEVPSIDHIAVTTGPGLEPALWVGINTAKALALTWNKPLNAINHMEGHVLSAVFKETKKDSFEVINAPFPMLALLVSGGHTELVVIASPLHYKKIGQTRDDAVGEAFDKTARILGLPYPGGPKISMLAREAREQNIKSFVELPRPMLHSKDYDFSYSGLKTATLYAIKDKELTEDEKKGIAREFEDAAIEVLITKTKHAIEEFNIQTLVLGGGVAANMYLREQITNLTTKFPGLTISFPTKDLSTDNSVMIGMTSYYRTLHSAPFTILERAEGNRSIEKETKIQ